jgi:peptidyl-prolyl cis-trans isomerase SurA
MQKLILIFIINLFFYQNTFGDINSKIIVKVENEIITNYDLKNKILTSLVLSGQEINQNNINGLKKNVLGQLIDLKLKKLELTKYKIEKDQKRINSYLSSISNNNLQDFKNKFFENNLNFDLFLDEVDTELRWQKLIYSLYSKKINIDEEVVDSEIQKIVKIKSNIQEYELSEIEINLNSEDAIEKKINNIVEKINSIGFENTAVNFSISTTSSQKGYLGWINSKALSKEIRSVLSSINSGEVSKPIVKSNSILFLKLLNKRMVKSDKVDVKKLKNDIIEQKKTDLFNLYSQSRLSKLKNSSYIRY